MKIDFLKTRIFLSFLTISVSAIFAGNAFAQVGTTGISGTITDQDGAIVPGATVKLTNPANGFTRTVTTNENGGYKFAAILPAAYTLEVEAGNFKKLVKQSIEAPVDNPVTINLALEPGNVSITIDVTTSDIESIVNTQDASIGNNFVPRQITQLPTDSRNVAELLSLQPGVTIDGYVNGGRSDQANITLDGIDVNDQQAAGAFESVLRTTTESTEEFRVTTTNPNAGQGRSSGAQISLVTKSGTNDLRGAAFYFKRPNFGSANTFINNRAGVEREGIDRDIFGGAIGGPIFKDKLFFFYSYEGIRQKTETSVVTTVPLADFGRGILKFFDEDGVLQTITPTQFNQIYNAGNPDVGINPFALAVFADAASRYPANDFQSGFGDNLNTAGFRFNAKTPIDLNTHILKFDYNLNSNQQLFVRLNKQHDSQLLPSAFPDSFSPELWQHNTGGAAGHIWTIGNNKVNNFRYGLTRQALTSGGDSTENAISFRLIYEPKNFNYTLSRITTLQNFTDDFIWTLGKHTLQFGGNVRIIRNNRNDTGAGFDNAFVNPSFYEFSGESVLDPLAAAGYNIDVSNLDAQAAAAALIGRFSQYSASFNYDIDGSILPVGTPIERNFATEEYDLYVQDSWKIAQNFTLNLGLRYGLSRPVYEQDGFQVRPNIPLGEYFQRRLDSAAQGIPYKDTLNFELAGPKNDAPGFYSLDTNNFQPRISAAWSPNFKSGFFGNLFGKNGESVFRGGFAVTNDYFGQQLAVTFNALSTLGFTTSDNISANTYNVTDNPAPLFMGFGQSIRTLPGLTAPNRFRTPADEQQRIESSLDSDLVTPTNYSWNFTYGRQLPKGLYVEASYVGRKARNLLVTRDVMALNNLVDPNSGMDWYTAAGMLVDARNNNVPITSLGAIPYFENLFPNAMAALGVFELPANNNTQAIYGLFSNDGFGITDYTFIQLIIDDKTEFGLPVNPGLYPNMFFHPQYAAFSAFSTVGKSDYHGGSLSVRQRFGDDLTFDLNYTFSKSMDDASGLQTSGTYGEAFILNPILQQDSYALSDFDTRHVLNVNGLWQLPFGKDRKYFSDLNPIADAFLGGWQIGGIFRYSSGRPFSNLTDLSGWATNWNVRSNTVRTAPIQTSPTRGGGGKQANLFSDLDKLAKSVRAPRPGETGDRNVFFGNDFKVLDMNLIKSFTMPYNENHKLELRFEVFNVLNNQALTGLSAFSINPGENPSANDLTNGTGQLTSIIGNARRLQLGIRFTF